MFYVSFSPSPTRDDKIKKNNINYFIEIQGSQLVLNTNSSNLTAPN